MSWLTGLWQPQKPENPRAQCPKCDHALTLETVGTESARTQKVMIWCPNCGEVDGEWKVMAE